METNVKTIVFPKVRESRLEKADIYSLCKELENAEIATELLESGTFRVTGPKLGDLFFPAFLDTDLTINLEKLELALILSMKIMNKHVAVSGMEVNRLMFHVSGWLEYFERRGIDEENKKARREELIFAANFINSILENESLELGEGKKKYNISLYLLE